MNPRKEIRSKIKSLLKDKTSFGDRIFQSRKVPLQHSDECDAGVICIYIDKETSQVFNEAPKIYKKTLNLVIAAIKTLDPDEVESLEDQLEDIASEIEIIMEKNDQLGGLVDGIDSNGFDYIDNEDGEFKEGAVKLTYSITYYVEVGLDEDDLNEYKSSNFKLMLNEHNDFEFNMSNQE